jgi:hypothetical protein
MQKVNNKPSKQICNDIGQASSIRKPMVARKRPKRVRRNVTREL